MLVVQSGIFNARMWSENGQAMRTLINELDYWIEKHNIRPEAPKALGACGRSGHAAESPELLGGLERSTAGLMPEPAGRREKGETQL